VRLIVRETFQHPSQFGRVSFPTQGGGEITRGATRDTLLRHPEDDDELGEDGEYLDGDDDDEDTDMHETDLEESDLLEPEE